jgi:hypothetical protein
MTTQGRVLGPLLPMTCQLILTPRILLIGMELSSGCAVALEKISYSRMNL